MVTNLSHPQRRGMNMRRRDENHFKNYLIGQLQVYGHIVAHEDKYSTGIPDTDYCFSGVAGWMELKIIQYWPKKADTNLHTPLKHLTNDQINWMKKRSNAGGNVYLLLKVMRTKEYLLFHGEDARRLKDCTQESAYKLCIECYKGSLPPKDLIYNLTLQEGDF